MKVTPEHYNQALGAMREKLEAIAFNGLTGAEAVRSAYQSGRFVRAEVCKDLNMRARWDLYHACGLNLWGHDYNDEHIDTALRKIARELGIDGLERNF